MLPVSSIAENSSVRNQVSRLQIKANIAKINSYKEIMSIYYKMILYNSFPDNSIYINVNKYFQSEIDQIVKFSKENNVNTHEAKTLKYMLDEAINIYDVRSALITKTNQRPDHKDVLKAYSNLTVKLALS